MADEIQLVENWLYSTLSADATLIALLGSQPAAIGGEGIFSGAATQGAVFPVVIIRYISPIGGGDLYVNGANRVWSRARFEVMAADARSDYEGLGAIASRIDTLLSIRSGVPITGGLILQSIRESPYRRPSFVDGKNYREVGAMWDVIAQAV